jgi:hypothetical protein
VVPLTGNDSESVLNGRGIRQRKLSREQAVALAADLATGEKPFKPSLAQACSTVGVPIAAVRAEIKARAAKNGNGGAETSATMAAELVNQLGLEGAFDLLIEAAKR